MKTIGFYGVSWSQIWAKYHKFFHSMKYTGIVQLFVLIKHLRHKCIKKIGLQLSNFIHYSIHDSGHNLQECIQLKNQQPCTS